MQYLWSSLQSEPRIGVGGLEALPLSCWLLWHYSLSMEYIQDSALLLCIFFKWIESLPICIYKIIFECWNPWYLVDDVGVLVCRFGKIHTYAEWKISIVHSGRSVKMASLDLVIWAWHRFLSSAISCTANGSILFYDIFTININLLTIII